MHYVFSCLKKSTIGIIVWLLRWKRSYMFKTSSNTFIAWPFVKALCVNNTFQFTYYKASMFLLLILWKSIVFFFPLCEHYFISLWGDAFLLCRSCHPFVVKSVDPAMWEAIFLIPSEKFNPTQTGDVSLSNVKLNTCRHDDRMSYFPPRLYLSHLISVFIHDAKSIQLS